MKRLIQTVAAVLLATLASSAQNSGKTDITGIIRDASDGSPIAGATILTKGQTGSFISGTTTDAKGEFTLKINPKTETVIQASFLGYAAVAQPIDSRTRIEIMLEPTSEMIEKSVVTALGMDRKEKVLNYSHQGVDATSLSENRTTDFISALQGRVAGLQIASAGTNTGSSGIVIRGYASATGDNNAIFVVDGVIMENGAVGGESGGIDFGNAMGDINPDDIADIQVLKGPNATALYGSRAANGVIMITTKRSDGNQKIKVSYGNNTTFQQIAEYPEYQNTFGVGMDLSIQTKNIMELPNPITGGRYRSWGPMMLGQPYIAIDGIERPYSPQPDNVKDFYRTAVLETNNITVEGGTRDNNIRLSYTNYYGNSIVEKLNVQKKHTFGINIFNRFTNWLELSTRVSYVIDDVKNRQYSNANNRNPVNTYVHMARSTSLDELRHYKDEFGNESATNRNSSNPYWIINENPTTDTRDRLTGSMNLTIKLPKNVKLLGRAGLDAFWWTGTTFQNLGGMYDPNGKVSEFTDNFKSMTFEGSAVWNEKWDFFSINTMIGTSMNIRKDDKRTQEVIGLVEKDFIHISNSLEKITPQQNIYKRRTNSIYGNISLGFWDMLFLEGTIRNDWSSTLPLDNCSFAYPSVGVSFLFSELLGTKAKEILSYGKARFSYAMVGNDTNPYRTNQTWSIGGQFDGSPYTNPNTAMNNDKLLPEITTSYEAGVELKFFRDRIGLDFTYYNSVTHNQIVSAYLTPASGYERRYFNAGAIRNAGIEITANFVPVRKRDFQWSMNFNFAKNNSMVLSLLEDYDVSSLTLYSASNCSVNAEVGKPFGYIRGIGVVKNEAGQWIMNDGGDYFETDDNMGFGTVMPKWTLGWSNSFSYKGFNLGWLIDFKIGGIMYSNTYKKLMTNGSTTENYEGRLGYFLSKTIYNEADNEMTHGISWGDNVVQRVYDEEGNCICYKPFDKLFTPSGYEYCRSSINEFAIFDASYIKVREINFGYSFPAKLLRKTPLASVKLSFVARNPFTLYKNTPKGIDPESAATTGNGRGIENGSLPPIRTLGFDIKITTK